MKSGFYLAWGIAFLGILALATFILVAGPYLLASLVELGVRLGVGVVLVLGWGVAFGIAWWLRRRANEKLLSGIAQGDDDREGQEARRIREQFEKAVETLKRYRRKGRSFSIYELPWYVIIGPPGAGKTTALRCSGLHFPLADKPGSASAVKGVGGTRNCDWWFTDDAVLLDTAGRFVLQDSDEIVDKRGWQSFLELLKRHRRRRPLNGVLLAISISDILDADAEVRAQHVKAIKGRLDELQRYFGMRFPTYVLITKTDLLPGFVEYFEDLGAEERRQVWGFTLPVELSRQLENIRDLLKTEFTALQERLRERVFRRLAEERDLNRRALVFGFPDQFAMASDALQEFLYEVFQPSSYEEPAFLRGVYFTSGTQDGGLIDRLTGNLVSSLGIAPLSGPETGRSFFLTRLLRDVAFAEAGLSGASKRFEREREWLQWAAYVGAFALLILGITLWSVSYFENLRYLGAVSEAWSAYAASVQPDPADGGDPNPTVAVERLERAAAIRDAASAPGPSWGSFGLSQRWLEEPAQQAYLREAEAQLMPRVRHVLQQGVRSAVGERETLYDALRWYLLSTQREALDEPAELEEMTLTSLGLFRLYHGADDTVLSALGPHLRTALEGDWRDVAADPTVLEQGRAPFSAGFQVRDFVLARLERQSEGDRLSLESILGPRGSPLVRFGDGRPSTDGIARVYTREMFERVFVENDIERFARIEELQWVLGNALDPAQAEGLVEEAKAAYVEGYIRVWRDLLASLELVKPAGDDALRDQLLVLAGRDSPMKALLAAVMRNTALADVKPKPAGTDAASAQVEDAVMKKLSALAPGLAPAPTAAPALGLPPKPAGERVAETFADLNALGQGTPGATALDAVQGVLQRMYDVVSTMGGGAGQRSALEVLQGGGMLNELKVAAESLPEPFRTWLLGLDKKVGDVTRGKVGGEVAKGIAAGAGSECQRLIGGRFPFVRDATEPVKLLDFIRVLGRGGVFDAYFNSNLVSIVDTTARTWRWREGVAVSPALLQPFQKADQIRKALFDASGTQLQVVFDVKAETLTSDARQVTFNLDGQLLRYAHGPVKPMQMKWPGSASAGEASVVFERIDGTQDSIRYQGPWALFRMLATHGRAGKTAGSRTLEFSKGMSKATFEVVSGSADNPFELDRLEGFTCPAGS